VSARGAKIYKYNVAYGAGKAALDKMTRDMADDLREQNVTVVSIWPNVTRTESLAASSAQAITNTGTDPWADLGGTDNLESPRYSGRAVVALATDADMMKRTGGTYWSAELGTDYGVEDEFGKTHIAPTLPV
jgi:NAD(P)-dependent dehydrogenase (short-subunit alcohol dehydrogenase family)